MRHDQGDDHDDRDDKKRRVAIVFIYSSWPSCRPSGPCSVRVPI